MKCTIKAKANIHRKGGCVAWSEHGTVPQLISGGDLKSRDPGEAEAASSLRTSTFPDHHLGAFSASRHLNLLLH